MSKSPGRKPGTMNNKHEFPLSDGNIEINSVIATGGVPIFENQVALPLSHGSVRFQINVLIATVSDNNLTPGRHSVCPGLFAHAPLELRNRVVLLEKTQIIPHNIGIGIGTKGNTKPKDMYKE